MKHIDKLRKNKPFMITWCVILWAVLSFQTINTINQAYFDSVTVANGITVNSGQINLPAGSAAAPAVGWIDSGLYEPTADDIGLSLGGNLIMTWDVAEIFSANTGSFNLKVTAGASNSPVFRFRGDANTGIWGSGDIFYAIAGGSTGITITEGTNILTTNIMGSQIVNVTAVASGTHTVLQTDYYLQCTYTATGVITITMPSIATVGDGFLLVVKDSGYNANNNNITVARNGSDTINNVGGNYTINTAGTSISFIANDTTDDWEIW